MQSSSQTNHFFSVIIPLYNKERVVSRAIKSVLSQTFSSFELLIVCDPSTDKSEYMASTFIDSRIKILRRNTAGPGGYAARNLGIRNASSNWITFLDADDEWHLDHLQNLYKNIICYPSERLFSSSRIFDFSGNQYLDPFSTNLSLPTCFYISFDDYLYNCILNKRPIGTNSVCCHSSLFSDYALSFPEGKTQRGGDLYLWILLTWHSNGLIFSNHISSISYRDESVIQQGSSMPVPNTSLNLSLFYALETKLPYSTKQLLKRYVNVLNIPFAYHIRMYDGKIKLDFFFRLITLRQFFLVIGLFLPTPIIKFIYKRRNTF